MVNKIPDLDSSVTTCNYIDIDFQHYPDHDWRDIYTPACDSIINPQGHFVPSAQRAIDECLRREKSFSRDPSRDPTPCDGVQDSTLQSSSRQINQNFVQDSSQLNRSSRTKQPKTHLTFSDIDEEGTNRLLENANQPGSKTKKRHIFKFTQSGNIIIIISSQS